MTDTRSRMWESRLSGSERGRVATRTMGEILWHRRETRRQTENTNVALPSGECPAYSQKVYSWGVPTGLSPGRQQPALRNGEQRWYSPGS